MSKALYRKYRPTKLDEIIGQPQVTDVLSSALKQGKINHAYLFIGPRGCGKTSVARIFAHEVNGFPYAVEDDYVDIVEIDGASNRGIDNIRELREKAAIAPSMGKYKIYIIDEVHMLTKEAFNALLKTLEEPPAHVIFIMATTDAYKVPVTITSRAQTYTFKLADFDTMFQFLHGVCEKEGIKIIDDALKLVVKRGGGSFRDSLSLLDQISTLSDTEITEQMVIDALGLPSVVKITTLLDEYTSGNVVKITTLLKDLLNSGVKPETIVEEMITAVIDDPKPELLPLLTKLTEIKAPFAEAKLLVALLGAPEGSFVRDGVASARLPSAIRVPRGERYGRSAPQPSVVTSGSPRKTPSVAPQTNLEKHLGNDDPATRATRTPAVDFDWSGFLARVKELNEVVHTYLNKCSYEATAGGLILYPHSKIAKNILSKDANKKIIADVAGMKVEFGEVGEKPENAVKDATLDKISAIMGGEVQNGGINPFE